MSEAAEITAPLEINTRANLVNSTLGIVARKAALPFGGGLESEPSGSALVQTPPRAGPTALAEGSGGLPAGPSEGRLRFFPDVKVLPPPPWSAAASSVHSAEYSVAPTLSHRR
ncbi:hypothetical protein HPB47_006528 [Ixodes persulcatus]|uniref:Uncharacterized protein n=1 Tax=Ixodes persulcatus TaxID=34615 RepID=A0AC60P9Z6_IXOPE|nr:hypothetical protein HPB47_006528 [Ixodes persulcatus]